MTEKMGEEFEAAFREKFGFGRLTASANADAHQMLKSAEWAWGAARSAIEAELREAYQKGWDASGEGWNAEYPGDCHLKESWQRQRDESLCLNAKG